MPKFSYSKSIVLGENNAEMEIDCDEEVCADPPQRFKPAHILTLPNYNDPLFRNDIALIKLNEKANITGILILHEFHIP